MHSELWQWMEASGWLHIQQVHFTLVPVEQEAAYGGVRPGMVVSVKRKQYVEN
jgi:hypothetical protein